MVSATAKAAALRRPRRGLIIAGILAGWLVGWWLLHGRHTLELDASQLTDLHRWVNEQYDKIGASRTESPFFVYLIEPIRLFIDWFVEFFQALLAQPAYGLPIPVVGWLGVVALAGYLSYAVADWKMALLAMAGFTFLGLQGLWQESMDTLAMTLASVLIALAFSIPLGVWAGMSDRFHGLITPVLDLMQIMPPLVYLAPLTLFFLIGPASAAIATIIYAAPPVIRLTAHGIRSVPVQSVEASRSLGASGRQTLTKVLLPMARRTIVLGVNQTMMAALSMVTIAALIDAPGLGKTLIKALQILDVGRAFNAGLAIVVMAIVLDRVTTAAARSQTSARSRWRTPALVGGGIAAAAMVWLSRTYVWAAEFPATVGDVSTNLGRSIETQVNAAKVWLEDNLGSATRGFKDVVTEALINPLQTLLTQSPWYLAFAAIVALALVIGSVRAAVTAVICLTLIISLGLWEDGMTTLASVLVAIGVVMLLGVVFGVWMGRTPRADHVIRPVLDAAQVMPPFVYFVPFLALFAVSRFTAIVAAIVYSVPVATKIIADGIRGVAPATVEAATASGSSTWQTITKVQLPMARRALALAANQGLIYVLSMVVVGGLVGGGGLGYDVVVGFNQLQLVGKGLAAGVAIVALGVLLDRITQAAANRAGRHS